MQDQELPLIIPGREGQLQLLKILLINSLIPLTASSPNKSIQRSTDSRHLRTLGKERILNSLAEYQTSHLWDRVFSIKPWTSKQPFQLRTHLICSKPSKIIKEHHPKRKRSSTSCAQWKTFTPIETSILSSYSPENKKLTSSWDSTKTFSTKENSTHPFLINRQSTQDSRKKMQGLNIELPF